MSKSASGNYRRPERRVVVEGVGGAGKLAGCTVTAILYWCQMRAANCSRSSACQPAQTSANVVHAQVLDCLLLLTTMCACYYGVLSPEFRSRHSLQSLPLRGNADALSKCSQVKLAVI